MEKLKLCMCIEFDSIDASEDPTKSSVSHGPIQPLEGILKQDGRCFRIEWNGIPNSSG